ncbi:MAG: hydroxymethylpyrimidine/phosphomethylpyrimidine kinase [Candidatus Aminicenantales bacterium]|jgi:hydroxymethylpyrimidine/phosphomethylpyrimidine kinase
MNEKRPLLLSIAGFDPSGGAGVLLDTAVLRSMGFRAAAILTAVTVQNTAGLRSIHPLAARLIKDQWRAVAEDDSIAGIKVGMVGTAENLGMIIRELGRYPGIPRVIDPVLRATSGAPLIDPSAVPGFLDRLRGQATLLTPNREEAARLARRPARSIREMDEAARLIFDRSGVACLVKGGRLAGAAVDVLYDGRRSHLFSCFRIAGDVHGTGCHLSSSIVGFLVRGHDLPQAVRLAAAATHRAIRKAKPAPGGRRRFDL